MEKSRQVRFHTIENHGTPNIQQTNNEIEYDRRSIINGIERKTTMKQQPASGREKRGTSLGASAHVLCHLLRRTGQT